MEKKYPVPKSHPIKKFDKTELFFFLLSIKIKKKIGKVIKLIKTKLYGGRLNAVIPPNKKDRKYLYICI